MQFCDPWPWAAPPRVAGGALFVLLPTLWFGCEGGADRSAAGDADDSAVVGVPGPGAVTDAQPPPSGSREPASAALDASVVIDAGDAAHPSEGPAPTHDAAVQDAAAPSDASAEAPDAADVTPATCGSTYSNPLIWEDLPDLEVIRVDDTYYYTASSFHHSPGAPLLRSYDLVHWEYLSHSVPVLDFNAAYDLNGGRAYVNGIWASSLKYRKSNQTFYWMGCMHNVGGGYVFTAKSPEGPWEKHRGGCYYDMGLLVDDDDKLYVAYGNNTIRVAELSADGLSEVRNQLVLTTPSSVGGPLEGSRFYKRNGIYYIFMTQYANGEWVIRSKNGPLGPYEGPRPFAVKLPYAGAAGSGASPHQGGIVETQNGQWYYIGFNDSYPAGRIPVMIPMSWSDDWPSVQLDNGKFGGSYAFPDLPCGAGRVRARNADDFFTGKQLSAEWEWNHNPDNSKWSLDQGLVLRTATVTTDLYAARNTLTRRIEGPVSIGTIALDYSGMQEGDVAGLAALRDRSAFIGVEKGREGARVVMSNGINMSTSFQTTSKGMEVAAAELSGGNVWLRVEADVRTNGGTARFSYSTDGQQFTSLGNVLNMNRDWQYFLGYRFGIFNYATQSLGGSVKIRSFTLQTP